MGDVVKSFAIGIALFAVVGLVIVLVPALIVYGVLIGCAGMIGNVFLDLWRHRND